MIKSATFAIAQQGRPVTLLEIEARTDPAPVPPLAGAIRVMCDTVRRSNVERQLAVEAEYREIRRRVASRLKYGEDDAHVLREVLDEWAKEVEAKICEAEIARMERERNIYSRGYP